MATKKIQKKESLIHIKLEYDEALEGKRDILASEASLLRIFQSIEVYKSYRDNELELKMLLYKKTKEVRTNIILLHKTLPALHMPEMLKKRTERYLNQMKERSTTASATPVPAGRAGDIQSQLNEIENRLNELQRR